jgi:hypothetical protein
MYMQPCELRVWALERQQRLTREYQESCAAQRKAIQQLGKGLHGLGQQLISWGQWLQTQPQMLDLSNRS